MSVGSSSSSRVAPRQLQQQDLEPGLLTARQRLELLLRRFGQLVAIELARRLLPAHPGPMIVAAMQDLQQRTAQQLGMVVGLGEPSRPDPGTEFRLARMLDRRDLKLTDRLMLEIGIGPAARQQPQEVRLARPVRAEHRDPVTEPDLAC